MRTVAWEFDKACKAKGEKQSIEKVNSMITTSKFYAQLARKGKDVVYYGDRVGLKDIDAVLMRWKISDDEYRVIYGNLTAENVSAEKLEQLEAKLPE